MKNILIIILFLSPKLHLVTAQSELTALEYLFMASDLVIQGTADPRPCDNGVGYENCNWIIKLDSIYKGNPRIDSIENYAYPVRYYKGDTIIVPRVPSVHYFMLLRHGEQRPARGQHIVLFLRDTTKHELIGSGDNRSIYTLVDRYIGWLPSNYFLSEKLSKLKSTVQK